MLFFRGLGFGHNCLRMNGSHRNAVGSGPLESPGSERMLFACTRIRHCSWKKVVGLKVERVTDDQLGSLASA